MSGRIQEEMLTPMIEIDMPLDFDQIDAKFVRILKQMGPFGPHNHQPVFRTDNVYKWPGNEDAGKTHQVLGATGATSKPGSGVSATGYWVWHGR